MLPIQLIIFLFLFSILLTAWVGGIFLVLITTFPILSVGANTLLGIHIIVGLSFLIGILGGNITSHKIIRSIYQFGAIGMGAITIYGLLAIGFFVFGSVVDIHTYETLGLGIFLILGGGMNLYGIYKGFNPVIREYRINLGSNHGWKGKKMILISDTHYGNIYGKGSAEKLVKKLNTLGGDIVLLPGDFFDGPIIDFRSIANVFKNIQAPHGVLFSSGNHDEYNHAHEILQSLQGAGMKILNGDLIHIDGIDFAGVPYHETETRIGLRNSLEKLARTQDTPTVLLKHKPTHHDVLGEYNINLVVSGHVHKGQMFPFSFIPYLVFGRYAYGKWMQKELTSITTSGVGTWGAPQRIGTSAEIVVITVE